MSTEKIYTKTSFLQTTPTPYSVYTMLNYFIVGLVVGFLLELAMSVTTGDRVNWGERIVIITLWPIMGILFIINFIRGFF